MRWLEHAEPNRSVRPPYQGGTVGGGASVAQALDSLAVRDQDHIAEN